MEYPQTLFCCALDNISIGDSKHFGIVNTGWPAAFQHHRVQERRQRKGRAITIRPRGDAPDLELTLEVESHSTSWQQGSRAGKTGKGCEVSRRLCGQAMAD